MFPNTEKTAMVIKDKIDNQEVEIKVCPFFNVERVIKKIPEKSANEEVEIFYNTGKRSKTFRIEVENFNDINIVLKACLTNYLTIQAPYKTEVYSELYKQLNEAIENEKFSYEHKCLGWNEFDGKKVFFYDKTKLPNNSFSTCIRKTGKFQNGDKATYDTMLKSFVFPNEKLSFAFILGFAGVISTRLSQLKDLGNPIVGLTGKSTTGKTTALKLIASIWGDPSETQGSLIMRNNASDNGLNSQYSGLYGVPILFDDLDTNKKIQDFSTFFYDIAKGTQRIVSTSTGDADNSRMGSSGIVIITNEDSLFEHTNQKSGLYSRISDFNEIAWTPDATTSEIIKETITTNYGFYGADFGHTIERYTDEDLLNLYNQSFNVIDPLLTQRDAFTNRIMKPLVIFHMTGLLLQKHFNFSFDINKITKLMVQNELNNMQERDKPLLAFNTIIDWYFANKSHFDIIDNNVKTHAIGDYYGQASLKDNELHLYVNVSKVKEVLAENKLLQLNNYKKSWKDRSWIITEKGRYDNSSANIMSGRFFHFKYDIQPPAPNNNNNESDKEGDKNGK